MKDIAKELQVSTVTVSKALSDKEGVSEAVRQKIKQKADEMGYRYNSLARSMKEGVSYNVGVVVAERFFSDNAFYANLYQRLVIELGKEFKITFKGRPEITHYISVPALCQLHPGIKQSRGRCTNRNDRQGADNPHQI